MSRHRSLISMMVRTERDIIRAQRRVDQEATARVRAQQQAEKAQVRQHAEAEVTKAEAWNADLAGKLERLGGILAAALARNAAIDLETLKHKPILPPFRPGDFGHALEEPQLVTYLPPPPSGIAMLLPFIRSKHEANVATARARYGAERADYERRERERQDRLAAAQALHRHQVELLRQRAAQQHTVVDALKTDLAVGKPEAVREYLSLVLEASPYPADFPQQFKLAYVPESKQVVVEYDLPTIAAIPEANGFKYVKARNEIQASVRPITQRKALYLSVLAQVMIRTIHEIFQTGSVEHVETVVFNGHVEAIDQGTGRPVRPCVITVRTTHNTFQALQLRQVDPVACLKTLNASVSKSPADLAAVRPVIEFNMVDPRFIEKDDILAGLDPRPNLMDLTPSEFENLISDLFEKMGLETRLTQASRDGGVDCVAFDQRPIFGGKVVIQAKRYQHTVGVSAVRDLFGTVQNEGASKGILVTTSGYGQAAFDFAKGKPLELLNGSNLLYLLAEHAGIEARIEFSDGWKDPIPVA